MFTVTGGSESRRLMPSQALVILFCTLCLPLRVAAQQIPRRYDNLPLPAGVVTRVTDAWKNKNLGRYMDNEEDAGIPCTIVENWKNWEGFKLKKCSYPKNSPHKATVVMLNPSRALLIKWVVAACVIKNGPASENTLFNCSVGLMKWIHDQSGSQFAVAGIVTEPEAYAFRDGLTVALQLGSNGEWTKPLTQAYQDASLNPDFPIARYGNKPRIASAQRQQYKTYEQSYLARTPTDTRREKYMPVIRQAYQDAWRRAQALSTPETVGKYRNDMVAAYLFPPTP